MATGDPYFGVSSRELSPSEALDECLLIFLYASLLFAILRPERLPLSAPRLLVGAIVALSGTVGHVLLFATDGPPESYVPGQFLVVTAMILTGCLVAIRIRDWVKSGRPGRSISVRPSKGVIHNGLGDV